MVDSTKKPETIAVRGGYTRSQEAEHSEAMFLTSSFVFEDPCEGEARMADGQPGNVYSRYTNPTVATFESRLADLEGAEACVATSSGMAAILSICMAFLKSGDHVICSRDVFGSTTMLLTKYIAKFGVDISFVALTDVDAWKVEVRPETVLFFLETPSNPLNEIADIAALADIAHANNVKLVVDNCFCTPIFQKPLSLGADIVMHSATKYIDGQGRCLGGAVVGSQQDIDDVIGFVRSCGPAMSPFNAWVFLKGLETLAVRMRAHAASAMILAEWLETHPLVEKVFYAGLESHSDHQLASKQQTGFSGVLSFQIKSADGQDGADKQAAWDFINATSMLSLTANFGDAKSTIVHPATTTHGRLTDAQREEAGIADNLIRLSVGLEDIEDIKLDLSTGFDAIASTTL